MACMSLDESCRKYKPLTHQSYRPHTDPSTTVLFIIYLLLFFYININFVYVKFEYFFPQFSTPWPLELKPVLHWHFHKNAQWNVMHGQTDVIRHLWQNFDHLLTIVKRIRMFARLSLYCTLLHHFFHFIIHQNNRIIAWCTLNRVGRFWNSYVLQYTVLGTIFYKLLYINLYIALVKNYRKLVISAAWVLLI